MRERKSLRTRACVGGCPAGRGFSARHGDIVRGRLRFGIQMLGMFRVFGVKLVEVI